MDLALHVSGCSCGSTLPQRQSISYVKHTLSGCIIILLRMHLWLLIEIVKPRRAKKSGWCLGLKCCVKRKHLLSFTFVITACFLNMYELHSSAIYHTICQMLPLGERTCNIKSSFSITVLLFTP